MSRPPSCHQRGGRPFRVVVLEDALQARLERHCAVTGDDPADIVNDLVEQHLDETEELDACPDAAFELDDEPLVEGCAGDPPPGAA